MPNRAASSPRAAKLTLLAGLCLATHFAAWIASLWLTSVVRSVALVSTQPLWAALLARALGHAEEHLGFVGHVRRLRIQATADPVHALSLSDELVVRLPSPDALLLRASLQPTNAAREADLAAAVDLARARLTRRATPLRRLALARALISAGQPTAGRRELAVVLAEAPDLDAARALAAQLPEDP